MWSESDLKYLIDNYSKSSNQEIGERLGKTKKSIDSKAMKLGLRKDNSYISKVNRVRTINRHGENIWTKEDLDFLTLNIDKMSNPELSNKLDKTINSIVSKIQMLRKGQLNRHTRCTDQPLHVPHETQDRPGLRTTQKSPFPFQP